MSQYVVREFNPDQDRENLLAFWKEERPEWDHSRLDWLLKFNGYNHSRIWLLSKDDATAKVLGCASIFMREFIINGENILGGVNCDFFVSKQHRTLGPSMMLMKTIVQEYPQHGAQFLLAYPNKKAISSVKRCEYHEVGEMKRMVKVLNFGYIITPKIANKPFCKIIIPLVNFLFKALSIDFWHQILPRGKQITITTNAPGLVFEKQTFTKMESGVAGKYNDEFVHWRYLDQKHPTTNHVLFFKQEKNVIGFISTIILDNSIMVEDIMLTDSSFVLAVMVSLINYAREMQFSSVTIGMMENSFYFNFLERCGFIMRENSRKVLIHCHDPELQIKLLLEKKWWLTDGDVDI